jgi:hypothetical protein
VPDPLAHATQGSLILLAPFIAFIRRRTWILILVLIGGVLGDLPDIIGIYGYMVPHDNGVLYESAHRGEIAEVLQYLPMYWLHTRLDYLTHDRHSYITRNWLWVEAVVWATNILIIWGFVSLWRRRHQREEERMLGNI